MDDLQDLIDIARPLVGEMRLARPDLTAATVACALRSASGRVFTGVCLHLTCGIGFCAEHAAVAEMLKARETRVRAIVTVNADAILVPCGRCRELLMQVDPDNAQADVALPGGVCVQLSRLLPEHWMARLA